MDTVPKPPPPEAGDAGLAAFRETVELYEQTLRNRWDREFHRKELARWQKLYATLADKREVGSPATSHFVRLSTLCAALLDEYGPEAPSKKRVPKAAVAMPIAYG